MAGFALRRLYGNRVLTLSTVLGVLVAVVLVTAVPLYAEGISAVLLRDSLIAPGGDGGAGILVRHSDHRAAGEAPTDAADLVAAERAFARDIGDTVGLPVLDQVAYLQSDRMPLLFFDMPSPRPTERMTAAQGFLASMTGLGENVQILEGRLPTLRSTITRDGTGREIPVVEAVMTATALNEAGLEVGEQAKLLFQDPFSYERGTIGIDIVGRIVPLDPDSPYWLYDPELFDGGAVFVERSVYLDTLLAAEPRLLRQAAWYSHLDVEAIRAVNYPSVRAGLHELEEQASTVLPDTRVVDSPALVLERFDEQLSYLKLLLFILSAPVVAIVLFYLGLTAAMVAERQDQEVAVLKSRGVGMAQIAGVYVLGGLFVGIFATAIGPPLGLLAAQLLGKTHSFLVLTNRESIPANLTPTHFGLSAAVAATAVLAHLLPAIGAARRTIVTYKLETARPRRRPFYQRSFLDFALLGVAGYLYYNLYARQSLLSLGGDARLFSDPLLVVAPVIFLFAVSLLLVRVAPALLGLLAFAGASPERVGTYLALQQLRRQPGHYHGLLLLLLLTFAFGTFSASMAATVDRNIDDRAYFKVGSDARFVEGGDFDKLAGEWLIPPVERHLQLVDETGAGELLRVARISRDDATLQVPGERQRAGVALYGVDPAAFARTVRWRDDFAPTSLNALMNALARDDRAVLLDRSYFSEQLQLELGTPIRLVIDQEPLDFYVAGWIDFFPTHFQVDGPYAVANRAYLDRWLGESPWNVLARLGPGVGAAELVPGLRELEISVIRAIDAASESAAAREDPTQIGTFGILTAGFVLSAGLTIVGFLVHAMISLRRRLTEIGILRAIGMRTGQLLGLFALETGLAVMLGALLGTALGLATGRLFVPFLQLSADVDGGVPPFVTVTAWGDLVRIFGVFAGVVLLAVPLIARFLRRMSAHETMRFGD